MFVRSFKASSIKFFAILALSAAAVVTLVALIPQYEPAAVYADGERVSYKKVKDADDCADFLSQFGWSVEEAPIDEAEIAVPQEFDKVFESYNTLQTKQGLDLTRYKGRQVKRYTFRVTNYEGYNGVVLANVIIYKNKVIAGDICSADVNGFLHGFSRDVTLP